MDLSYFVKNSNVNPNVVFKLWMNFNLIIHYIKNLRDSKEEVELTNRRKGPCKKCKNSQGNLCRKHSIYNQVMNTKLFTEISDSTLEYFAGGLKLYAFNRGLVVYDKENKTLLIIDCPLVKEKQGVILDDQKLRKVVPFTFFDVKDKFEPKSTETLDIKELSSYKLLSLKISKSRQIVVNNIAGEKYWELSDITRSRNSIRYNDSTSTMVVESKENVTENIIVTESITIQ